VNEEFVDLRRGHLSSESFWPSFTDIMMVVVIIFLLTSMLLMVKNRELFDQLRNSMAAEEQAEIIIQSTSQENATLEEQLAQAQNEVSMLRMQMLQASEQANQLDIELEDKNRQIVIMLTDNAQLKSSVNKNENQILRLSSQINNMQNNFAQLSIDIEQKQSELDKERQKVIIITQERDTQLRKMTVLKDDFGSLKVKYDKLIKPARTAKDKYVVSVNFERIKGKGRIRFKGIGDKNYTVITEKQMHSKLTKLKKKYPKKLYIKIVIPKESGLTYNEAWTFMKNLLNKYDYYYNP
jgi:predicted nuclease with TOPRIM domain